MPVKRYAETDPPATEAFQPYERIPTISAARIAEPFELVTIHGVVQGQAGDYIVAEPGGLVYFPASEFEARYRRSTT